MKLCAAAEKKRRDPNCDRISPPSERFARASDMAEQCRSLLQQAAGQCASKEKAAGFSTLTTQRICPHERNVRDLRSFVPIACVDACASSGYSIARCASGSARQGALLMARLETTLECPDAR